MPDKFYTPEQIAELLQVKPITVRRWLRSGKLQGYRIGSRLWRISQEQLEDFLNFEIDFGKEGLYGKEK